MKNTGWKIALLVAWVGCAACSDRAKSLEPDPNNDSVNNGSTTTDPEDWDAQRADYFERCTEERPENTSTIAGWSPVSGDMAFNDGSICDASETCMLAQLGPALVWSGQDTQGTWDEANSFCEQLELGGRSWRLPTQAELEGIRGGFSEVASTYPGAELDSEPYWSSTTYSGGAQQLAYFVHPDDSLMDGSATLSSTHNARCVTEYEDPGEGRSFGDDSYDFPLFLAADEAVHAAFEHRLWLHVASFSDDGSVSVMPTGYRERSDHELLVDTAVGSDKPAIWVSSAAGVYYITPGESCWERHVIDRYVGYENPGNNFEIFTTPDGDKYIFSTHANDEGAARSSVNYLEDGEWKRVNLKFPDLVFMYEGEVAFLRAAFGRIEFHTRSGVGYNDEIIAEAGLNGIPDGNFNVASAGRTEDGRPELYVSTRASNDDPKTYVRVLLSEAGQWEVTVVPEAEVVDFDPDYVARTEEFVDLLNDGISDSDLYFNILGSSLTLGRGRTIRFE